MYDAGVASRDGMGAEIDSSKPGGTIQAEGGFPPGDSMPRMIIESEYPGRMGFRSHALDAMRAD